GINGLEMGLLGNYQVINACLAVDTAMALSLSEKAIRKGLAGAKESGRFERICERPLFYIDGAHNEPASVELRECIKTYFTKKRIIYIIGMLRDKDIKSVIANTADLAECIFTVATPNTARTLSSFELAEAVREFNPMVTSLDSIEEAVEMASMMAMSDKNTVILAFGSLSHLKRVKDAVSNIKNFKTDCHGAKR
ncbi:MAG: bifunctional folylpolyglutamate synthase/dihydrofolate synthase, partial [Lachnospiraceae bacterium]|nr:bifunctional folylpolyglutamate synthase/dihydrofolate synthase [Lachnospiraceae bacterium]